MTAPLREIISAVDRVKYAVVSVEDIQKERQAAIAERDSAIAKVNALTVRAQAAQAALDAAVADLKALL